MAPTMRWRMPPDICGDAAAGAFAARECTAFGSSPARPKPWRAWCLVHADRLRHLVTDGEQRVQRRPWDPAGSWRCVCRAARISNSDFFRRSSPSNSIRPPAIRAVGRRRRMVSASVLAGTGLADDAQRLAGVMRSETSSTARTTRVPLPRRSGGDVVELEQRAGAHRATDVLGRTIGRSRLRGSELTELGIEFDTEPIAEEVRREHHQHDADAGQHGEPPVAHHHALLPSVASAPRPVWAGDAHAEERQGRLGGDDHAEHQRAEHDSRVDDVGQDVAPHDGGLEHPPRWPASRTRAP